MNLVKNILSGKSTELVYVAPDTSVLEALHLMADNNIGSVIVMNGGRYLGIFTERDYSRKVILKGKNSTTTRVYEIMSVNLPELHSEDSMDRCMELMNDKNIRYLPVMENDRIIGIISISDVVRQLIMVQEQTIQHLENYIHS